jgi:hypothetical protein
MIRCQPNTFSTISGGALVDEAVWPVVPEVEPELELEASVGVLPDELAAVLFEELLGRMPLRDSFESRSFVAWSLAFNDIGRSMPFEPATCFNSSFALL